jgi:hypothetical protein
VRPTVVGAPLPSTALNPPSPFPSKGQQRQSSNYAESLGPCNPPLNCSALIAVRPIDLYKRRDWSRREKVQRFRSPTEGGRHGRAHIVYSPVILAESHNRGKSGNTAPSQSTTKRTSSRSKCHKV